VGLLSVDPQGRLLEINMAGAILLGIQRSRSTHHVFTEFLSDEAQEAFLDFHAEVMSGKCRRHCELALKPTAQKPALVVRIDATVDEDGLENRMVMSDITEQVQEAQALAAREREQRAWLEHLPGVFWIKDEMGRFVAVNHLAQRHGRDAAAQGFEPVSSGDGHMHFVTSHVPGAPRSAGLDN
jgi:PAS domain-containing protein